VRQIINKWERDTGPVRTDKCTHGPTLGIESPLSIFYEFDEIKYPMGLKSEYLELFKDGTSEGKSVGIEKFFSRKIFVILTV
jgi:hypothetical protein